MPTTTLGEDGDIQLPADLLKDAGWSPGDRLVVFAEGRSIVIVRYTDFEATRGIASSDDDWYERYRDRSR